MSRHSPSRRRAVSARGHEHGQKQKEQEEKKMNGITAFALSYPIARLLGEWSMGLNTYSIILRIAVAVIFASVIGCERSSKRHSAGLRTFVLISFASTVSMILDIYLMTSYSFSVPVLSAATIIGTAMVSGNSILFSSRNQIKGLTTSAGLWACGIPRIHDRRGTLYSDRHSLCFPALHPRLLPVA